MSVRSNCPPSVLTARWGLALLEMARLSRGRRVLLGDRRLALVRVCVLRRERAALLLELSPQEDEPAEVDRPRYLHAPPVSAVARAGRKEKTHDDEGEPEALAVNRDGVDVPGDDAPLGVEPVVGLVGREREDGEPEHDMYDVLRAVAEEMRPPARDLHPVDEYAQEHLSEV